jgi:hypothetical protein
MLRVLNLIPTPAPAVPLRAVDSPAPLPPPPPPPPALVIPHGTTAIMRLSDADHHRDPCEIPSLSSSIAKELLEHSPAHAHAMHPRYGAKHNKPTRATDFGSIAHVLLLGEGPEIVAVDAKNWQKKAAKQEAAMIREAGGIPVLLHQLEQLELAVAAIRAELDARKIVLDGACEMSVFWTEEAADGTVVQCRGRIDHVRLLDHAALVHDLKSIHSARPDVCARQALEYGYHVQRAAYVRAIEALRPELAGRVEYSLAFFELAPPYAVTPATFDGRFRAMGEMRWRRAVNIWARCQREDRWPAYVRRGDCAVLEPPPWALHREIELEDDERRAAAEE